MHVNTEVKYSCSIIVEVRITTMVEINYWTNGKICVKVAFPRYTEVLNLGLKAEKQLKKENHTDDWVLGNHPRDNGHVTH